MPETHRQTCAPSSVASYAHSESMEPMFERGDLLILAMPRERVAVGDVCVYKLKGRDVPIVHRVIKVHDEYSTCTGTITKL